MRLGRSSLSSLDLENSMYCRRSVGRLPGRLASSIRSCASVSVSSAAPLLLLTSGSDVGSLGCDMAFCPVMTVPSARPAEMWWEKLLLMAGRTDVDGGMEQI